MLTNYNFFHKKQTNQILLINKQGIIIDSESDLFIDSKGKHLSDLHPFFDTIIPLLNTTNKQYNFDCINLTIGKNTRTVDGILNTEDEHAVFVFQDLTEQYILYQKVAQLRNEAEIKSQLYYHINYLLKEKEAFKDDFIANFTHAIRMPVNTISGFTALLEDSNLEQSQRYNLNIIKNTNEKLRVMINEILDISKIESGHFTINSIRYNLLNEFDEIISIYTKKCEKKGLKLNYKIDEKCPKYVIADKYRLAQIASNLIGNAIKFTEQGSIDLNVVCKTLTKDKATIQFSITDTGIGIEQDQLEVIYKSFYQVSNKIRNDGSGLGLAIVKELVNALDGTIEVNSTLGEGTTFTVTLDFEIDKNQKEDKHITKTNKTTANYEFKILLAEPSKRDQAIFLESVSKSKKFDVVIVETGDDVVEELHKQPFDIAIFNLKLPTMDGLDTARYIRHSDFENFKQIPIMILSKHPSKEEEQYCKQRRINSYLGKPYDKDVLLRKIKYLIKKKQAN
ncbi:ATP-binding protein [uncultured Lacinutrix sp.]|uniref:ATP-binding response regulator n=1 Tax=uncultured Lacinutrix sp. TaxID=574032 RepID=UPI0026238B48|nr:ATP-binding protein [uncultured Lacinutrix sp.]